MTVADDVIVNGTTADDVISNETTAVDVIANETSADDVNANATYTGDVSYKYFVTPRQGNWWEAERMCEQQGGNLVSESLKSKWGLKELVFKF